MRRAYFGVALSLCLAGTFLLNFVVLKVFEIQLSNDAKRLEIIFAGCNFLATLLVYVIFRRRLTDPPKTMPREETSQELAQEMSGMEETNDGNVPAVSTSGGGRAQGASPEDKEEYSKYRDVRFLYVDDNPENLLVGKLLMENMGMTCWTACSGKDAIEICEQEAFGLILMDCQMPEMDGYQTSRLLRSMGGPNCNAKIIALTANAMPGDREKCIEAGMDDYMIKPLIKEKFIEVLDRNLSTIKDPDLIDRTEIFRQNS